jgi:hypothetical protein
MKSLNLFRSLTESNFRSIEEHIEVYREKMSKPVTPPAPSKDDKNIDMLFSELEPNIIKQKKVILVEKTNENPTNFSRLEAKAADIPIIVSFCFH